MGTISVQIGERPKGAKAMNYAGIDIHKRYSVCAAQDERGRLLKEARIGKLGVSQQILTAIAEDSLGDPGPPALPKGLVAR